jgi:glycerol-3-phosphate acyltransferase PlsX
MGGDDAPAVPVEAARRAAADGLDLVLVGEPDAVGEVPGVRVVPSGPAVGMHEDGALGVRAHPDASVRVAVAELAAGRCCAVVSAGNTGATLTAALLGLGRLPGLRRPAVGAVLPVGDHGCVLVDAGATPDAQPAALLANARMGVAYARVRGVAHPRVGLLNVGTEPHKGSELTKAAYDLLGAVDGFVGNVEPDGVLAGHVDVVVTDGFTGNVLLKTVEALSPGAERSGAAALLGVPGTVLVAHGAAPAADLVAALRMAADLAKGELSRRLAAELARD